MPVVRGCNLPDDLLYDVDSHTWYRELDGGKIQIGMTQVAVALAGKLVAFTPKKVGKPIAAGKSCATVESGKWVGPAKSAVGGNIASVNEALVATPTLANDDPYVKGWMIELEPEGWADVKPTLTPGASVSDKYEAKMAADGFAGCAG